MTFDFRGSVYCDQDSESIRRILSSNKIKTASSQDKASLIWLWSGYFEKFGTIGASQALNHLPLEKAMTDKAHLTRHLRQYAQKHPQLRPRTVDFYPETYCLHQTLDCQAFFASLAEAEQEKEIWILKPANSSMGRGIKVFGDPNQLKPLSLHPQLHRRTADGRFRQVIQKYIRNPLLLEGRKSEIRIYWLVGCVDPLKVFVFPEGTVRLAAESFTLANFANKFIHVTNIDQQKDHPGFADLVFKWTFADLEKYLEPKYEQVKPGFLEEVIMPQVYEILAYVAKSCGHLISRTRGEGYCFGLYGADFILDQSLKPWLTEIQLGPGYNYEDKVKARLIPRLVQEAVQIAMEMKYRKSMGEPIDKLDSQKEFVRLNIQ